MSQAITSLVVDNTKFGTTDTQTETQTAVLVAPQLKMSESSREKGAGGKGVRYQTLLEILPYFLFISSDAPTYYLHPVVNEKAKCS